MSDSLSLVCEELIGFTQGQAHLQGSQCADCGETYFPAVHSCTRCLSTNIQAYNLGNAGVLWSWTIQEFLPKPPYNSGETPANFKPYGVGYVQMPCGLKLESRLTESHPDQLSIGIPMNLVLIPYRVDADGKVVHTFAFAPTRQHPTGASHA